MVVMIKGYANIFYVHLNPCPAIRRTQLEIMLGSIAIISRLFVSCRV